MYHRNYYTFFFLLISFHFTALAQHTLSLQDGQVSPDASIEDVAWIAGHWRGEAFGGITEEIWSPPMGKSIMGMFRLIKEGKVDFYEMEIIVEENGGLLRTSFGGGDDVSVMMIDPQKLQQAESKKSYIMGGYVEWKAL